jgi:uncharacterized protein YktB (UPF0637 family)
MRYREYSEVAGFGLWARFLFVYLTILREQHDSHQQYHVTAGNVRR